MEGARRRDLGGARSAPSLHAFEGHGLGGGRPRGARDRGVRLRGTGRQVARDCATRSTPRSSRRATTPRSAHSPSTTGRTPSTRACSMIPLFGFLPATDPRMKSTIEKIESDLTEDGFVLRYRGGRRRVRSTDSRDARERFSHARSGWPTASGCSGARTTLARSSSGCWRCATTSGCSLRSTTRSHKRQVGNFPQAFSHVSLVNTACNLSGQAARRGDTKSRDRAGVATVDDVGTAGGCRASHGFLSPPRRQRAKQADRESGGHPAQNDGAQDKRAKNNRRSDG